MVGTPKIPCIFSFDVITFLNPTTYFQLHLISRKIYIDFIETKPNGILCAQNRLFETFTSLLDFQCIVG